MISNRPVLTRFFLRIWQFRNFSVGELLHGASISHRWLAKFFGKTQYYTQMNASDSEFSS